MKRVKQSKVSKGTNQSEVIPAYMNASATIRIRRRGSILIKIKTGRPLESSTNRMRNTPTPVPRIRAIILYQISSGVLSLDRIYILVHQDVSRNTIQVVLGHENLLDDVLYKSQVLLTLRSCVYEFVVKLSGHQELVYPFRYADRLCS